MFLLRSEYHWGTWVAQSVQHLALDFGLGHDLTVHEIEPCVGLCADNKEPAWDSLSLSLPLPCLLAHALSGSLKINIFLKSDAALRVERSTISIQCNQFWRNTYAT